MNWGRSELEHLLPILEQVSFDLRPIEGKKILVLCSSTGEMAFWLGEMMEFGQVTGLELDSEALVIARRSAHEMGLESTVQFLPAEIDHIPLPDASFDALVSEFIVYPTSTPTQIGQPEMARVLKPGGRMILTDVILDRPLDAKVRDGLSAIGLDYLCEGTQDDFYHWMSAAGLTNIRITDMTPIVRQAWEIKRKIDRFAQHQPSYADLLDDTSTGLGKSIYYIYVYGEKPPVEG